MPKEYIVREDDYPLATGQTVVGELVRCKNCKHFEWIVRSNGLGQCVWEGAEDGYGVYGRQCVDEDWYCVFGERREDG